MEDATLTPFAKFGQVTRYAHVATYTAFVYDWLLCLGDEADMLSTPGPGLAKLAYICCRYCLLLSYPATLYIQGLDHQRAVCAKVFRVPMLLAIPNLGTAVSILTLRLYAFTGGNWILVLIILACYLAISAYHIFVVFGKAILNPLGNACVPVEVGKTNDLGSIFLGSMLLDTFITIAFITYLVRVMKLKYTQTSAITRTFLRQGAMYFIAISSVNLLNVAFNLQHYEPMADINVPYSLGLPCLLACRMVLDLRTAGLTQAASPSAASSEWQPTDPGSRISYAKSPTSAGFARSTWSVPSSPFSRDRANFAV